jgi:hypothetical protein
MFNFDPLYLVYGGLALFPAIIWISFLFKRKEAKKIQLLIFLLGSLSVIPIFLIQYLFQTFPNFDIITVADQHISNPFLHFLLIYAWPLFRKSPKLFVVGVGSCGTFGKGVPSGSCVGSGIWG